MLQELNERLTRVIEGKRNKSKWQNQLKQNEAELTRAEEKAKQCADILQRQQEHVQKLFALSMYNLFHTLLGDKQATLDKDKQEALRSKLQLDEVNESITRIKHESMELRKNLETVQTIELEYQAILEEKERLIADQHSVLSEELFVLSEQEAIKKSQLKEVNEAIAAGHQVEAELRRVVESLEKAKNWGTWDMLGGGLLTTAIKHSHIDDARAAVHEAQNGLRRFERELKDIHLTLNIQIDIGNLMTFADYFFDGLITDWIVQGRITDSLDQAVAKRDNVLDLVRTIEQQKGLLEQELQHLHRKKIQMIEDAI